MRKIAEDLVADYADTFPAAASQIRRKWDELSRRELASQDDSREA